MTSSKRNEQNQRFGAGIGLVLALNGLFALVYTFRSASSYAAHVWNVTSFGGFAAIAAVLVGAYFFASHDKRRVLGVGMALAALLTQVHIFYTQPGLLGWLGAPYYAVNAIAVLVVVYDRVQKRRATRHEAFIVPIVTLDDRRREASSHAA